MWGRRGKQDGRCNVLVDGQQVAAGVDLSREYEQQCLLFKSELLQHGRHTLRIECCCVKGALSHEAFLAVYGLLWLPSSQDYGHSEL